MRKIDKFNRKVAVILSDMLSSVYFLWFCVLLVIIVLWKQPPTDILSAGQFLSQTIIQLWALPILAVSGNIQSARMERKLNESVRELKQIILLEKQEDEKLAKLIKPKTRKKKEQ